MPNWKKLITSGSDAYLNSLTVATNVTASEFYGDLIGTASYAINTGEVFGYSHTQSSPTGSWVITHNLGSQVPMVQVYDASHTMVIPKEIQNLDENTTKVTFDYAASGFVNISKGTGTTEVSVKQASKLVTTEPIYMGSPSTDGSFRFISEYGSLRIQKRVYGVWTTIVDFTED